MKPVNWKTIKGENQGRGNPEMGILLKVKISKEENQWGGNQKRGKPVKGKSQYMGKWL